MELTVVQVTPEILILQEVLEVPELQAVLL
jgi:hypothetical protein